MYHIAVISCNTVYLDKAVEFLSKYNDEFSVITVSDYSKINEILKTLPIDIYVCDHDPPQLDAFVVFDRRLAVNDFRPFVIASKICDNDSLLKAFEKNVSLWVPMGDSYPISFLKVSKKIIVLVEKYRAELNNKINDRRLQSMVKLNSMHDEDFTAYMTFALEESINLTSSEIGYLALYDKEKQELNMKTWSKKSMEQCMVENRTMKYYLPKSGLWGEPVRRKRPIVLNDYSDDSELKKGLPKGHIHLKKLMMIPLMDKGEVIGTAGVGNKLDNYNETDLNQFILMMEGFTHIYVEKKRIEESNAVQKRLRNVLMNSPIGILVLDGNMNVVDCSSYTKDLLGLELDFNGGQLPNTNWITDSIIGLVEKAKYSGNSTNSDVVIGNKYEDGMKYRVRVFHSEEMNDEKPFILVAIEDYTTIANMSGVIENSLLLRKTFNDIIISMIKTNLRTIEGEVKKMDQGDLKESLSNGIAQVESASRLIKEYGDIGIIDPEWMDVTGLIRDVASDQGKNYKYSIRTDGVRILADYTFRRVFTHLLENGIKRGKLSLVSVSYKVIKGRLLLIYEDDANGIPYDAKSKCFNEDVRRDNLDFFIINAIIKSSKFSIDEVGDPTSGARFEITIPLDKFEIQPVFDT